MQNRLLGGLQYLAGFAGTLFFLGCGPLNRQIDSFALNYKAQMVVAQSATFDSVQDSRTISSLPFRNENELERISRPSIAPNVRIEPLINHRNNGTNNIVQEKLSFASGIELKHSESNQAVAYIYRHGKLGSRPVILWVPGQNTSNSDVASLITFFEPLISKNADVILYVPPYHLERTPKGFNSGDAILATDFCDHLKVFAQELSDIRTLIAWLRAQGVLTLGAVGSSMGASMLLRLATWEATFDFLVAMVPVIDWNQLIRRPEMAAARTIMAGYGTDEELRLAYRALDARTGQPLIDPARISIFYGRFDLIAPEAEILSLRRLWSLSRVRVYERGHALFSIGRQYRRDVRGAIETDLWALQFRHSRPSCELWRDQQYQIVGSFNQAAGTILKLSDSGSKITTASLRSSRDTKAATFSSSDRSVSP